MEPCKTFSEDQLDAYILGICSPQEHTLLEEHLNNCLSCSEHVAQMLPVKDNLLATTVTVHPSEKLKNSIMSQVRAEAALFEAASITPAKIKPKRKFSFSFPQIAFPALGLAFAVFLAVVLIPGNNNSGNLAPLPNHVYAAKVDASFAPQASASLSVQGKDVTLDVSNMPQPGAGRVYEVWLHSPGGVPKPAQALFDVTSNGGQAQVIVPGGLQGYKQILVTSEPAGGSPLPTRTPVISVSV